MVYGLFAGLIKSLEQNKEKNNIKDFSELITDINGLPIDKWKKKYPNFYKWLIHNGFEYNPKKDKSILNKK